MLKQLERFFRYFNLKGIPVPTITDPKTGKGSVSLTLVVMSSGIVLIGLIGKWSNMLGGIDLTQALYFFGMCAGLYFGRTVIKKKNSTTIKQKENE